MDRALRPSLPPLGRQSHPVAVELTTAGWQYNVVPYPDYDRHDNIHYGAQMPPQAWLLDYEALALPEASSPAWTPTGETGWTVAVSAGELTVTDSGGSPAAWLFWSIALDTLAPNAQGNFIEAQLAVTAAAGGTGQGIVLCLRDGTRQFAARTWA